MVMIPTAQRLGDMPSGEPVPEATYALRCDKAELKFSKERKTPMVEATLTIFGPDSAEEFHGRKIFENFMLDGEGMFKTRQFFTAAGFEEDFVLEDTDQFLTLEVGAVVQEEKERTVKEKGPDGKETTKTYPAKNRVAKYISLDEVA